MEMKFPESTLAHQLLDGLHGVEIGGSAHNPFGIAGCINVDYTDDMTTEFKLAEMELCGEALPVDIVAPAWALPILDSTLDFVLSSHVLEHCWDVIGTLKEWVRVLKPGGLIFMVLPHRDRTFDRDRETTSWNELCLRHSGRIKAPEVDLHSHCSVWVTQQWEHAPWVVSEIELIHLEGVDDKCGNGFTVVLRKL
jgi:SAM-dependent methyltransferase